MSLFLPTPTRAARRGRLDHASRRRIAAHVHDQRRRDREQTTPVATIPMHALHQVPDHLGRFGAFGGRFVPETLMDALNQLAEEYERGQGRSRVPGRARRLPEALRRPALAALPRRAADRVRRRGRDLPQARRPEPHRRPQDQQRDRPGDAGPADGQDARHRRDRRRAARRRHGHGLRPLRPASARSTWARKTSAARSSTSST